MSRWWKTSSAWPAPCGSSRPKGRPRNRRSDNDRSSCRPSRGGRDSHPGAGAPPARREGFCFCGRRRVRAKGLRGSHDAVRSALERVKSLRAAASPPGARCPVIMLADRAAGFGGAVQSSSASFRSPFGRYGRTDRQYSSTVLPLCRGGRRAVHPGLSLPLGCPTARA